MPLVQSNTCDHRATILPLTAATGDPVLCVVIFASEKADVESNWHTGIDTTINPILDQNGRVDLLNIAWAKSFAQVESNCQAVAARRWYPPTKKILQDPSLWDLQDQEALQLPVHTNSIDALCKSTNLSENLSGSVIGSILTHAARKEGIKRRQELLVDGKERQRM